jgi:hypothetical protein
MCIVEKIRTGEFFAAKIVSIIHSYTPFINQHTLIELAVIGKSNETLEACDAVLGEQIDPQVKRKE